MEKNLTSIFRELDSHFLEYLAEKGITQNSQGFINCLNPHHPDRNPSMHIIDGGEHANTAAFCFSCLSHVDLFQAVHVLDGKPINGVGFFEDTLVYLTKKYGITYEPMEIDPDIKRKWQRQRAVNDVVNLVHSTSFNKMNLKTEHVGIKHLIDRGITEKTIKKFKIGCIDSFKEYIDELKEIGWTDRDFLNSSDLANKGIFNKDCLIIPIFDHKSSPVGFVSRTTKMNVNEKGTAKYVNSQNNDIYCKGEVLFNFNNYEKEEGPLYIVEGYLDAIYLTQCGLKNVAALGSTALTEQQVDLLMTQGVRSIILCLDSDNGGKIGTKLAIERIAIYKFFKLRIMDLPKDDDPDSFVRREGIDSFKEKAKLENCLSAFAWTLKQHSFEDDPIAIAKEAIPTIAAEESSIERVSMIKELAKMTSLKEQDIRKDVDSLVSQESSKFIEGLKEISNIAQVQLSRKGPKEVKTILTDSLIKVKNLESLHGNKIDPKSEYSDQIKNLRDKVSEGEFTYGLAVPKFPLLEKMYDGLPFNSCMTLVGGRPSAGKCNIIDTPIMMYDGSIKMVQNIKIGDKLMGPDSKPRTVISLGSGEDECYMIHQNRGMSYGVNSSHILTLKRSRKSKYEKIVKKGDIIDINVIDYINSSKKFKSNYKGFKVGVEFEERNIDIDPYFLGLWLGDDTKSEVQITTPDKEIESYIYSYARSIDNYVHESKGCNCKSLRVTSKKNNKIIKLFRKYDLINNKHIPFDYISNSRINRLKLLAGILDTDGYFAKNKNYYELTMKSEDLIDEIKYLCDTLGLRCIKHSKIARIKSLGYSCKVFRLTISGNLTSIPCRVSRKKATDPVKRDWKMQGIKEIEPIGKQKYYGFQLLEDPHYLYKDGTVTHNTTWLTNLGIDVVEGNPDAALFYMSIDDTADLMNLKMIAMRTGLSTSEIKRYRDLDKVKKKLVNDGWDWLEGLKDRFVLADAKLGKSPDILEAHIDWMMKEYPDHKILFLLDNFHKLQKTGNAFNKASQISDLSERIKDIVQTRDIHLMMTVELRKLEGSQSRPRVEDMKDSVQMEYDAESIILVHNDYQVRQEETNMVHTEAIDGEMRDMPLLEVKVWKNKITGNIGGQLYKLNSHNLRTTEVTSGEKAKYRALMNQKNNRIGGRAM